MKVLITQSNYIPWKGYFDNLALADTMVVYDSMQYTKRDWRNRNRIKTKNGLSWLTIPVMVKGRYDQQINDVKVSDPNWALNHLNILESNYREAGAYEEVKEWMRDLYNQCDTPWLTEINQHFLMEISNFLEISVKLIPDNAFDLNFERTERLVSICKNLGASQYISGPAAKSYMEEEKFDKEGIEIIYSDYRNYPVYDQLYGPFVHEVSILDLILHTGDRAKRYLKYTPSVSKT